MHLYVEGGGNSGVLQTACRQGFSKFLSKAGLQGHMPRIVACGGRRQAYDDFCIALAHGKHAAMLLVDSEDAVTAGAPWAHLLQRPGDQWPKPYAAEDKDCHFMVRCMESWFLADRGALRAFFGQGYSANALPAAANPIESIDKARVLQALANATKNCKTKVPYGKGEHSFALLARIDPAKVADASRWAKRFLFELKQAMHC